MLILDNKLLQESIKKNKKIFHKYIDNIKKTMQVDIYSVINTTLISNPYTTKFPKKFFAKEFEIKNKKFKFFKSSLNFYARMLYLYISYLTAIVICKLYYKNKKNNFNDSIYIDTFLLVDNIIRDDKFSEKYLSKIYSVLDKRNISCVFLPRLQDINKNPFKLIKLFKILNKDKRNFLFEYELLNISDIFSILWMILLYPFKSLRLTQTENNSIDELFNSELLLDIQNQQYESFSRYIYGKNIAKIKEIKNIFCWDEFQVIERAFNYGVRTNNQNIKLIGCQFYLTYETYFNAYIYDTDEAHKTAYHKVLVNGKYNLKEQKYIKYKEGVSLRYENIYKFDNKEKGEKIILLGSYFEDETRYMIESANIFDEIIFKSHPTLPVDKLKDIITDNFVIVDKSIYSLFQEAKIVIGTASGTCVEAVACGVSVLVIASQNNLTANSLVEYGQGKIWDIAFNRDDVKRLYNQLTEYRKNNLEEIKNIAKWYRENFFIEPTEENIVKAFELDKD